MAYAALIVGILGLIVAGLTYFVTRKGLSAEANDRREGLELLRRQIEGEEADRRVQRSARLYATAGPRSGGV